MIRPRIFAGFTCLITYASYLSELLQDKQMFKCTCKLMNLAITASISWLIIFSFDLLEHCPFKFWMVIYTVVVHAHGVPI